MTSDISALMDGELAPEEAGHVLSDLKQDAGLREAWAAYHLIGDSLRQAGPLATDLGAGIAKRLAAEPTILAPPARAARPGRFPALALAASVSAFGFVGLLAWQVVKVNSAPAGAVVATETIKAAPPVQLAAARAKSPAPAKEPAPVKFSAAAGNSYLLAHQEFSPSYAMAGMPAYVRTVSATEQDGGQ